MGYSIAAGGAAALASLGVYIYKSSKKAKTLVGKLNKKCRGAYLGEYADFSSQ